MDKVNLPLIIAGIVLAVCCISYFASGVFAITQKKEDNSNYYYGAGPMSSSSLSCIGCIALIAMGAMGLGKGMSTPTPQTGGTVLDMLSTISSESF